MTQNIKNLSLVIFFTFFIGCKNESNSNIYDSDEITHSKESKITNNIDNSNYEVWISNTKSDENYTGFEISISNDSIKVVKENEIVCKGEIIKEKQTFYEYFKSSKTGLEVKKRIEKDFDLILKDTLSVIMNAFGDISKTGCQFPFSEMFVTDNHLFIYDKKYQIFIRGKSSKRPLDSNVDNVLQKSKILLPYNKKIDIENIKYERINVNYVLGLKRFSCNENETRYISLPRKDRINLILIPQDCADFPYRFYLLTIKDNKIISNLYVEGEWFEIENYNVVETTSFKIDENYIVTVNTENKNSEVGKIETKKYKITEEGKIVEMN